MLAQECPGFVALGSRASVLSSGVSLDRCHYFMAVAVPAQGPACTDSIPRLWGHAAVGQGHPYSPGTRDILPGTAEQTPRHYQHFRNQSRVCVVPRFQVLLLGSLRSGCPRS